jgi:hypothetical protein
MRSAFYAALALTALPLTMAPMGSGPPAARACPTSAGMADGSKPTKPSSFAPHPRPPGNAYGAPVGGKILTRRVKKKPAPHADAAHSPAI